MFDITWQDTSTPIELGNGIQLNKYIRIHLNIFIYIGNNTWYWHHSTADADNRRKTNSIKYLFMTFNKTATTATAISSYICVGDSGQQWFLITQWSRNWIWCLVVPTALSWFTHISFATLWYIMHTAQTHWRYKR